ncbi:MAG: hypothetical protein ABH865_04945 [Candidatus Omnitrophota bacterium]|nr:hypothetical protein [Candidatus Omnitrophota bacterium]
MKDKKPIGIVIFSICYFLLAILFFYMVYILFSGKLDWALHSPYTGEYTSFQDKLFSSTIFGIIPGLWYLASAVLLYRLNSWGRWLPLPLVLICGILGMYVLFPLLIAHIIYFNPLRKIPGLRPGGRNLQHTFYFGKEVPGFSATAHPVGTQENFTHTNVKEQRKIGRTMKIDTILKLSLAIAVLIISLSIAYYYAIFLPRAATVRAPMGLKSTTTPARAMVTPPSIPIGLKGTIIQVVDAERFVVINLGEATGLRRGAQMTVLREDKEIGTVTIIETRKEISAADISNVVSGFTLQTGDTVVSK